MNTSLHPVPPSATPPPTGEPKWYADSANMAIVVAFAAAYLMMFSNRPHLLAFPVILWFVGLGLIFLGLALWIWSWVDTKKSTLLYLAYFVLQIVIGGWINYYSGGNGWLILLPLVGQALSIQSLWIGFLVGVLALAMLMLPYVGREPWVDLLPIAASLSAGIFFTAVFSRLMFNEQRNRREVERLANELQDANQKLRQYAMRAEELAVAQERNRLAREIHDGLGHYLTAVNMQIKAAQAVMKQDPARAEDALNKAQTLAQDALADVRRSVSALRELPTESRPLPETLQALLAETQAAGVQAQWQLLGVPRKLSPQAELALYRAAQEGLTNIRKHASATQCTLTLDYSHPERVQVRVQDNGLGRDAAAQAEPASETAGFGLLGLRERAQLLGGQVRAGSQPEQGFVLEMEIPG